MNEERERLSQLDLERKASVEQLTLQGQRVNKQIQQLENDYHDEVLSYLGGDRTSPLADRAEDILEYTEKECLDPRWFFDQANRVVTAIRKPPPFKEAWKTWERLPQAQTPSEYLDVAIEMFRSNYWKGLNTSTAFDQVKAKLEESEDDSSSTRTSRVIGWVFDNYPSISKEVTKRKDSQALAQPELKQVFNYEVKSFEFGEGEAQLLKDSYKHKPEEVEEFAQFLKQLGYRVKLLGSQDSYTQFFWGSNPWEVAYVGRRRFQEIKDARRFVSDYNEEFETRLKGLLTDSQKKRIDIYRRNLRPTNNRLRIGVHSIENIANLVDSQLPYISGVKFGLSMPEVIKLIDFGLEKGFSPEETEEKSWAGDTYTESELGYFLSNSSHLLAELEYDWNRRGVNNNRPHRSDRHFYTDEMIQEEPRLGKISNLFTQSLDLLFDDFTQKTWPQRQREVRSQIAQARQIWEETPSARYPYDRMMLAIFDFVSSDTVEVLARPTRLKYLYETQSYKIYRI